MSEGTALLIESADRASALLDKLSNSARMAGLTLRFCAEGDAATSCLREMLDVTGEVSAVLIGLGVKRPLATARQVYRIDPVVQIIFLADTGREAQLRREMSLAPMIGNNWSIVNEDAPALVPLLKKAALSTGQRRQLRTTIDRINVQLSSRPPVDSTDYQRLVLSDRYLASILAHAQEAIIFVDVEENIVTWNRAAERLLGYGQDGLIARPVASLAGAPWEPDLIALIRAAQSGGDVLRQELVCPQPDGSHVDLELTLAQVRDDSGCLIGVSAVGRDITERKKVERQREQLLAREQAARLEAEAAEWRAAFLAKASATLSATLDYEATLAELARLAVPEFADWCVIDIIQEGGKLGRAVTAHTSPVGEELLQALRRRYPLDWNSPQPAAWVLRTGRAEFLPQVSDEIIAAHTRDAEHLRLMIEIGVRSHIAAPLIARGRTLGVINFGLSSTRRHYTEKDLALAQELAQRAALAVDNARLYREAREASRLKDEFLATVSHELRTPLNAMLGWVHLLRAGRLNQDQAANALETIERNARSQNQLIEDLLDVSRIITGKLRLDVCPVQPISVIEAAIEAVRPAAEAKSIRLQTTADPKAGPISGDPGRLQQVMWNLLSNAIKFTPKGGRVQITLARVNSHVEITVSDTGQGIPAEFLPHVFERFRQADATSTRQHGGLGLGLAIVRHLVELHGGEVEAYSAGEGQGTTFTVKLPLMISLPRPSDGEGRDRLDLSAETGMSWQMTNVLDGVRVLAVDDEPDARDLLAMILSQSGAEVRTAASTPEALAALAEWQPAVLVSDIEMPGEDGYTLIQKIRALPLEHGGRIPAAALTAYGRSEDRRRAIAAGFDIHMPKPVEPSELVTVISRLAGRAGAE